MENEYPENEDDLESEGDDSQSEDEESQEEEQEVKQKPNVVKQQREEIKALKKALKAKEKEVKLDPSQETEARFFFVENPEAKEMKDEIRATIAKFPTMSFEEAFTYAKAMKPKESQTKKEFDLRTKSKPADTSNMTDDEASENLSPSEYLKYTRSNGLHGLKGAPKRI